MIRMKHLFAAIVIFSCSIGLSQDWPPEWKKEGFEATWEKARTALMTGDYRVFMKHTVIPDPMHRLTEEEFKKASKIRATSLPVPDLSQARFLRFLKGKKEALVVVQLKTKANELNRIFSFKFSKVGKDWKLVFPSRIHTFHKTSPAKDKQVIEDMLENEKAYQL